MKEQNATKHLIRKILYYFVGIIIVILFLVPFLWMFLLSFKDNMGIFLDPFSIPEVWDFSLYVETFKTARIGAMLVNSLKISVTSVGVGMLVSFCSSYAIARLVWKGRKLNNFIYYLFLAGSSIPIFAQMMTIYKISFKIGQIIPLLQIGNLPSLFLPYVALQIPFATLILVGGLRSVPTALEEAAIIDGCSLLQLMFRIVLPTIKPVFMTALIINFLTIWNEFPLANILLSDMNQYTVPMATLMFKMNFATDYGAMLRAAVMLMIPQMIFYLAFQKNIVDGMATAGIKG